MAKCSFCSNLIESGKGTMLVKKDGKIFYFDSKKCEKNMEMGRDSRKLKWVTKANK